MESAPASAAWRTHLATSTPFSILEVMIELSSLRDLFIASALRGHLPKERLVQKNHPHHHDLEPVRRRALQFSILEAMIEGPSLRSLWQISAQLVERHDPKSSMNKMHSILPSYDWLGYDWLECLRFCNYSIFLLATS